MSRRVRKGYQDLFASKSTIWQKGNKILQNVTMLLLVDAANYHQLHQLCDTFQAIYEQVVSFLLEDNELTEIAEQCSV